MKIAFRITAYGLRKRFHHFSLFTFRVHTIRSFSLGSSINASSSSLRIESYNGRFSLLPATIIGRFRYIERCTFDESRNFFSSSIPCLFRFWLQFLCCHRYVHTRGFCVEKIFCCRLKYTPFFEQMKYYMFLL